MPDRSSHQGLPEEWNHGSHAARGPQHPAETSDGFGAGMAGSHRVRNADGYDGFGAGAEPPDVSWAEAFGTRSGDPFGPGGTAAFAATPADAGTARPEAGHAAAVAGDQDAGEAADARGFLGALFDFGFTSFVTPKVIKVLYLLIVIGTVVSALVFTIVVFKASVAFGVLTLVFGDPLFILIVLAIYRVILEFFVVTFRVAEDIRALRERGDLR
jgi:hypothetical protein